MDKKIAYADFHPCDRCDNPAGAWVKDIDGKKLQLCRRCWLKYRKQEWRLDWDDEQKTITHRR